MLMTNSSGLPDQQQGVVTIGKHSYSGADIKLMIYSDNKAIIERYRQKLEAKYQAEIRDLESKIFLHECEIATLNEDTATAYTADAEQADLQLRATLYDLESAYMQDIAAAEDQIDSHEAAIALIRSEMEELLDKYLEESDGVTGTALEELVDAYEEAYYALDDEIAQIEHEIALLQIEEAGITAIYEEDVESATKLAADELEAKNATEKEYAEERISFHEREIAKLEADRQEVGEIAFAEAERIKSTSKFLIPLATVASISISAYRPKFPVLGLGGAAPRSFTSGPRTVAGSIVFIQFDEHALAPFMYEPPTHWAHELTEQRGRLMHVDQLPPMTIVAQFANEYGSLSELTIFGVEFIDDGLVMSIEDLFTENTCTYVARDYNTLLKRGDVRLSGDGAGSLMPDSASSALRGLKSDVDYQNYMRAMNVVRRDPYK
jgi:hypothetical protein